MTKRAAKKADNAPHPWCSFSKDHADDCLHCAILNRDYPFAPGETELEASRRYFPLKRREPLPEPEKPLVMIRPGRHVEDFRPVLVASEPMETAAQLRYTRSELERYLREESVILRRIDSRTGEEIERVEATRTDKIESFKTRSDKLVLRTDGHTREVRKVATTIAHLEKHGNLTKDLAIYLHKFAQRVADGHGAATEDGDDSTSRLTASYEAGGGGSFGSKTYSDRRLDGLRVLQEMKKRIPRELMPVFDQIVNEETSGWHDRKRTLAEIGEMIGYKHKQQSAAGGALVYAVVALIAHYCRESRFLSLGTRDFVAE
jgi:hypothetical protein